MILMVLRRKISYINSTNVQFYISLLLKFFKLTYVILDGVFFLSGS